VPVLSVWLLLAAAAEAFNLLKIKAAASAAAFFVFGARLMVSRPVWR
jgi:hypothetical protein